MRAADQGQGTNTIYSLWDSQICCQTERVLMPANRITVVRGGAHTWDHLANGGTRLPICTVDRNDAISPHNHWTK